jgi:hypothetical protein
MVFDSVFLDRYTKVWAEVAPLLSHELEALRHCFSELALRPRTIIKLRYAEGETSEPSRHLSFSKLSASR